MWPLKKRALPKIYTPPLVPSDDEIVESAPHTIAAYTNVAHGTFGYAVLRLALEGRLKVRSVPGVFASDMRYVYEAVK